MNNYKITTGWFFNCPEERCIKELFYSELEDVFGVHSYLYESIIEIHNQSIVDSEFVSKILMYPDNRVEYPNNSNEYKTICNLINRDKLVPECISVSRVWMYSIAAKHCFNNGCNNCVHRHSCFKDKTNSCNMFIDEDVLMANKTADIVRRFHVQEIAKCVNFDMLVAYMKRCNVSAELLFDLKMNHIVFLNISGHIGALRGHAQVYETREKAISYAESLITVHIDEAKKHQRENSLSVIKDGNTTTISYATECGQNTINISVVSL
jgi:hypothetical protein